MWEFARGVFADPTFEELFTCLTGYHGVQSRSNLFSFIVKWHLTHTVKILF